MADETIGSLKVDLKLNEANFTRSMRDVSAKMRAVNADFKVGAAGVAGYEKSLTGLQANSRRLQSVIELQRQRVQRLREEYDKASGAANRDQLAVDRLAARYNKGVSTLKNMQSELSATNRHIAEQSTMWGRLATHSQQFIDVGSRVSSVGQSMTHVFGAATLAIGGGLVYAAKTAMDFDAEMSKVGAISGANSEQLGQLRQSALDLGASTNLSASEVATAQENMAAAGFKTNQIIEAMPGVISAATASGEDLALVSDTVSTAINSFGLSTRDASHVADVLAQSANDSAAGVEDMSYTFKYAAAPAHALGYSLEDLSAATEIMANAEIRGETAGTALRAALIRMVKPPKQAREELDKLGVSITDGHKKMRPFSDIMGDLSSKTSNMSKAQRTAALSTIFGTDAVSAMLPVVEAGRGKIDDMTKSLRNSDGASDRAAKKMRDNLKGSIDELKGSIETMAITVGEKASPAIRDLAGHVQDITDWFNKLDPATQKWIVKAAMTTTATLAAGTAFGAMTMAIGGGIKTIGSIGGPIARLILRLSGLKKASGVAGAAGAVGNLGGAALKSSKGLSTATRGAGLLSGALGAITNPVGLTVLGLGAAGVAAYGLYKHFHSLEDSSTKAGDAIGKQRSKLNGIIKGYDDLRLKSQLTTKEFGRFVDIQSELAKAKSPATVKRLREEADKLREKSGLSDDQLKRMVSLNHDLVKAVPGATDKITEQGNRIAENTDKAKKYNNILLDKQIRKYEEARNAALGNESKIRSKIAREQDDLKSSVRSEAGLRKLANEVENNGLKTTVKKYERIIKINGATSKEGMIAKGTLTLLHGHAESLFTQLSRREKINDQLRASIKHDKSQLDQANQINAKIAHLILLENGVNDRKHKGIVAVDVEIRRQQSVLNKLRDQHNAGKLNTAEYNRATEKVRQQIKKLQDARNKVIDITGSATILNRTLSKKILKHIKFTGDTKEDAETIDRLLAKETHKEVQVGVKMPPHTQIREFQAISNAGSPYSTRANGASNLSHGELALVGERGREFIHDPHVGTYLVEGPSFVHLSAGSSVLKNADTERLGKQLGLPGFASGVGTFFHKIMGDIKGEIDFPYKQLPGEVSYAADQIGDAYAKALQQAMIMQYIGIKLGSKQLQNTLSTAIHIAGYPSSWLPAMTTIAMHESGGRSNAVNPVTVLGQHATGLMQMLPSTFRANAMAGFNDIRNPLDNGIASARYIDRRYGNPWNTPGMKSLAAGGRYTFYANGIGDYFDGLLSRRVPKVSEMSLVQPSTNVTVRTDNSATTRLLSQAVMLLNQLLYKDSRTVITERQIATAAKHVQTKDYPIMTYQAGG